MRRLVPGLRWQIALVVWLAVMGTSLALVSVVDQTMTSNRLAYNEARQNEAIAMAVARWDPMGTTSPKEFLGTTMVSDGGGPWGDPNPDVWIAPDGVVAGSGSAEGTYLYPAVGLPADVPFCEHDHVKASPNVMQVDGRADAIIWTARAVCGANDVLVALPRPDKTYLMVWLRPGFQDGTLQQAVYRDIRGVAAKIGLFAALGAYLLSGTLMGPARRAGEVARRIGDGDLAARVEVHGFDEIAQLGSRMNEMAASLQGLFAAQRHFISDTAHELRTPTAALLASASALENPATRDEAAGIVAPQLRRLSGLTEDLLALSRFDNGREELDLREVDLVELARGSAQQVASGQDVRVHADHPVMASLDAPRIATIVRNLVGNGFQHGAAPVRVLVSQQGDTATIRVDDAGPGVAADVRGTIFDRFVRGDGARHGGGSGLGLAIAKENATLHGGRLELVDDGHAFLLTLPLRTVDHVEEAPLVIGRGHPWVTELVAAVLFFGGSLVLWRDWLWHALGSDYSGSWLENVWDGSRTVAIITALVTGIALLSRRAGRGRPRLAPLWCLAGMLPLLGFALFMNQPGTAVALATGWVCWGLWDLANHRR